MERDAEGEAEIQARIGYQAKVPEYLPPQLLFVHQVILSQLFLNWTVHFFCVVIAISIKRFNKYIMALAVCMSRARNIGKKCTGIHRYLG